MKLWQRLLPYFRPHLVSVLAIILLLCMTASSALVMIPIARFISDQFSHLTIRGLNIAVALAIAAYLFKGLFLYVQNLLLAHVSFRVVADLRAHLFSKILSLSLAFHRQQRTGEVASRLVADVTLLREAIAFGFDLIPNALIFCGAIISLFFINWHLALFALVGIPLVALAIDQFGTRIRNASHVIQGNVADILAYVQEAISSILVVKSFGQEKAEGSRFHQINESHFWANFRGGQIQALQNPAIATIQILAFAGVIWFAGWEILHGHLAIPDLFAFGAALGVAIDPTLAISNAYGKFQLGTAALARVVEILDTPVSVQEASEPITPETCTGEIRLENLGFSYEDRPVVSNVDLTVRPGEMLALVGPSGGGKTTLANLILRFFDPVEGQILLDGNNLKDLSLAWLRTQIGYVPQDNQLFRLSVAENIRYGKPDATLEEVMIAAKAANADAFIQSLPQGYETLLEERGTNLSGGQRQRLAIARALLLNPKILILDEATSALDNESEVLVQEALERLMGDRTLIVIAHRLSTVRNADRIAFVENGRLTLLSSYEELLEQYPLEAK